MVNFNYIIVSNRLSTQYPRRYCKKHFLNGKLHFSFTEPFKGTNFSKVHFTKVYSIGVCEPQNCPGVISHRKIYPYSKKLGFLKTAKSCNFEIVNFIQIGRFLAILSQFSQKKRELFLLNFRNKI